MVNAKKNRRRQVEVTWVPVRDRHGRTHMEARWRMTRTERTETA